MINVFQVIYNKDYGFGNEIKDYDKNNMIAIPYSAVDNPIDKSEFTDPELTTILTTLSYYYNHLRIIDIKNFMDYFKLKFVELNDVELFKIILKDVLSIFEKNNFN